MLLSVARIEKQTDRSIRNDGARGSSGPLFSAGDMDLHEVLAMSLMTVHNQELAVSAGAGATP